MEKVAHNTEIYFGRSKWRCTHQFQKPSHADDSELAEDDVIIRHEKSELVGMTFLNASKRAGSARCRTWSEPQKPAEKIRCASGAEPFRRSRRQSQSGYIL